MLPYKSVSWINFDMSTELYYGSAQIARDVSHKFLRIGIQTSVYDDPHMMLMSASLLLGPDDAAVGFSHSGASTAVLEPIALARKPGARTIAVTSYRCWCRRRAARRFSARTPPPVSLN
jgi:DNA-binding MurR/RpiR family transcriptional regulator